MDNLIHFITPDNFVDEVITDPGPFLLLCMPEDDDFLSQLKIIEVMARRHVSWLKVGIVGDAFIQYFKQKLNAVGTPTFLIFFDGKERNRLLGLADPKGLEQFVFEVMEQEATETINKNLQEKKKGENFR